MEISHREQLEVDTYTSFLVQQHHPQRSTGLLASQSSDLGSLRATMHSLVDSLANNPVDDSLRRQQQLQLQELISEIVQIDVAPVAQPRLSFSAFRPELAARPAEYSADVLAYAEDSNITPDRAALILAYAARVRVHPDRALAHARADARNRVAARAYRDAADARNRDEDARARNQPEETKEKVNKQSKIIKIAELNVVNADSCAICMENHRKGDEVVTNCGHHFGTTCFTQWETAQVLKQSSVSCPCCRVNITQVTGFRRRAAPRKKI